MAESHGPTESSPPGQTAAKFHAIATALDCPDRFWIAAPSAEQQTLVESLVDRLRERGERVLVLTARAETADRLAERFVDAGAIRALAPGEAQVGLSSIIQSMTSLKAGAGRVEESRQRLMEMIGEANATIERSNRAAAAWIRLKAFRCTCSAQDSQPDSSRVLEPERARSELPVLRRELEAIAPLINAKRSGRIFSKDYWRATLKSDLLRKADELENRIQQAERVLEHVDDTPLPAKTTDSGEYRRICDELKREGFVPPASQTPQAFEAAWQLADGNRQEAEATLRYARKALAELESDPDAMAVHYLNRAAIVVGPFTAKTDPAIERGTFDRRILEGAESVTQSDWEVLASKTDRTILLGEFAPHSDFPQPGSIIEAWSQAHRPIWRRESGRLVAVLEAIVGEPIREVLADRSDVELRFGSTAMGEYVLGSVAFAPNVSVADAKALLASELGEVRIVPLGPARWHADELSVTWPMLESDDAVWIDVEPGVRERVVVVDGLPATAGVQFDANLWSRAAAEAWIESQSQAARRQRTAIVGGG